jgi:hypothetical protein
MRIGRQRESRETSPLRRRAVPDYTQRGTKMKIFVMIAALMVVLAFIDKARDPKTWNFLWQFDQSAQKAEPKFTNRLPDKPLRTAYDQEGTFVSEAETNESAEADQKTLTIDPVQRAWDQGWKDVYDRLDADRRALLFQMMHSGVSHANLAPEKQTAAGELLAAVTTLWEDYQAVAFQSVAKLTGDDQAVWVDVLRQVNNRFSEQVRPALQGVIDGRTLTESEEQALVGFQATLVALTRERIVDDFVGFRPAEREIWFHEWTRVRDASPVELKKQAVPVAYLQLFDQPADYRGKIVTLRGTVEMAYRVQAPANDLGIEQYFVYWIDPHGGKNAPIVVYALAAPPGFPKIKHRDLDRGTSNLKEEVEITGVFFKRWAYLGQEGNATYTAPLILAKVPEWTPAPPLLTAADRLPMTVSNILLVAAATLVLGLLVGVLLYKVATWRRGPDYAEPPTDMTALKGVTLKPTASEALRDLEQQARSGKLEP